MVDYFSGRYWAGTYFASGYWGIEGEAPEGAMAASLSGHGSASADLTGISTESETISGGRLAIWHRRRVLAPPLVPAPRVAAMVARLSGRGAVTATPSVTVEFNLVEIDNDLLLLAA